MKKKILLAALAVCALSGCHRTCVCYGYDQLEHRYSEEEVDQKQDGNCANMVYQANTRYLSVCHWE